MRAGRIASGLLACCALALLFWRSADSGNVPAGRREVVFWHFWGGAERPVVEQIVARFNRSQQEYYVRPVAMPGNNLDLKLFLAVTGGHPPDLINQDDPILADWAVRGAIEPLDRIVPAGELEQLATWLLPAAQALGSYQGRLYALCNGLDVRALYYNQTLLERYGLKPPQTLADLDRIAATIAPASGEREISCLGFLPNPRNIWAWGIVFGGSFYDASRGELTLTDERIVRALEWMAGYGRRYGAAAVALRARDQSLPGKTFPLLTGRYATVVDGQWRVRDIREAQLAQQARGELPTEYGVCALPPPPDGPRDAGWINGNFFLIPRGASNPEGAWEFMKFWSGFGGQEAEAAATCAAGGWIPVSSSVVAHPVFQHYLADHPLFATFVRLAAGRHQVPRPNLPGASQLDRELWQAAEQAMYGREALSAFQLLESCQSRFRERARSFGEPTLDTWRGR
jgi:multiple sugar transport system substrate-binding protein